MLNIRSFDLEFLNFYCLKMGKMIEGNEKEKEKIKKKELLKEESHLSDSRKITSQLNFYSLFI